MSIIYTIDERLDGELMSRCDDFIFTGFPAHSIAGVFLAVVLAAGTVVIAADSTPAGDSAEDANARLAVVRAELSRALRDSDKATKNYFKVEHDIVYTNAVLNRLYLSVKDLEKTLLEKKKELQDEVMKSPSMREATKERMDAFEKVSRLKERERVMLKELHGAGSPGLGNDGKAGAKKE